MKKILLIFAVCVVLVLGVGVIGLLVNDTEPEVRVTTLPEIPSGERPEITTRQEDTAVRVSQKDGKSVIVRDFLTDTDTYEVSDDGIYVIGSLEQEIGDQYKIYYFDFDGSITVSLLSEPLALSRKLAEEELKESLGMTEGQLCDAVVVVNTPAFISDPYSGRDLGLSFCPGSVSLE